MEAAADLLALEGREMKVFHRKQLIEAIPTGPRHAEELVKARLQGRK